MDETIYKGIIYALSCTYDPCTPATARLEAHQYLEQFKTSESCSDYAFYILSNNLPEHNDILRHFALHCLHSQIETRWNILQTPQQQEIRSTILGLVANLSKGVLQEAAFVKEKFAGLISNIAEREFPQRWTEFWAELVQIWCRGDIQADVVMIALTNMSQDCKDGDFNAKLPAKRRNEVLRGLNALLPELLPFFYNYASTQFQRYQQAPSQSEDWQAAVGLLARCIGLLEVYLPWWELELVAKPEHDFLAVFLGLLAEPPLRSNALQCIHKMCSHKLIDSLFGRMLESFPKSCAAFSSVTDPTKGFSEHSLLCEIVSSFLSLNLNKIPLTQDTYTFLEFFTSLVQHPSIRVTHPALQTWSSIARDDAFLKFAPLKSLIPRVLFGFSSKLPKSLLDESGLFTDELLFEEFADHSEYIEFLGRYRGMVLQVTRAFAERYPAETLLFLQEKIRTTLETHSQAVDNLDAMGHATRRSEAYRQFEPMDGLVEAVVCSIPETAYLKQDPSIDGPLDALFQMVLQWSVVSPILFEIKISILKSFHAAFKYRQQHLMAVLQIFFDALRAGESEKENSTFGEFVSVRRLGCQALITCAKAASAEMLPLFEQLFLRVQEYQAQAAPTDTMLMQLFEMLVLVSNAANDIQQRSHFLSQILAQSISLLCSEENQRIFASPEALLIQMGVTVDGNTLTEDIVAAKIHWYNALFVALNTLLNVGKRVAQSMLKNFSVHQDCTEMELAAVNPFVTTWQVVFPMVAQLIRTLHLVWAPELRDRLKADTRGQEMLAMSVEELRLRTSISGVVITDDTSRQEKAERRRNLLFLWPVWMTELRNTAYQLVGLACHHRYLYLVDGIVSIIQQSVLLGLEHVEHRHLSLIIKQVMSPFVLNMPISRYESLLLPVFTPFAVQMLHKFSLAWNPPPEYAVKNIPAPQQIFIDGGLYVGFGITSENREIIIDKIKREATRAYVEFLQELFAQKGELAHAFINIDKEGKAAPDQQNEMEAQEYRIGGVTLTKEGQVLQRHHAETLLEFLLHRNPQLTESLLMLMVGALCWADSHSCRRAVKLVQRVVEVEWKNDVFTNFLASQLFQTCVYALIQEPKWLVGLEWDIIMLVQLLYMRFVFGGTALDKMNGESRMPSDLPRQFLMSLQGISATDVSEMETTLTTTNSHKDQKDIFRDLIRRVISSQNGPDVCKDKAALGESVFREKQTNVVNLPEELVINSSRLVKQQHDQKNDQTLKDVVDLFNL